MTGVWWYIFCPWNGCGWHKTVDVPPDEVALNLRCRKCGRLGVDALMKVA